MPASTLYVAIKKSVTFLAVVDELGDLPIIPLCIATMVSSFAVFNAKLLLIIMLHLLSCVFWTSDYFFLDGV